MKKIAVFFGGPGKEYEVSLSSTASFLTHASSDYQFVLIGVSREGVWLVGDYTIEEIKTDRWSQNLSCEEVVFAFSMARKLITLSGVELFIDGAINLIHGSYGEDGTLSALLNVLKIPYIGSDIESSSICFDKEILHRLFYRTNILMPNYQVIHKGKPFKFSQIVDALALPFVVKPAREGSSYGVHLVRNETDFHKAITDAFLYDNKLLLEEYISGQELGCAVMRSAGQYLIGDIDEIELQRDIFDYEAKYQMVDAKIICPARISEDIQMKIKQQAIDIFEQLDCKDFARIDFFLSNDGRLLLSEVNTIPGFTHNSRFPNMFNSRGINFSTLIDKLLENLNNETY